MQTSATFMHGLLQGWFLNLISHNADVKAATDKATAAGISWQQIFATVLPLLIPAFIDILTGNPAALTALVPQIVAAIMALINPTPPAPAPAH